jgi:hypothetical protein
MRKFPNRRKFPILVTLVGRHIGDLLVLENLQIRLKRSPRPFAKRHFAQDILFVIVKLSIERHIIVQKLLNKTVKI